MAKVLVVGILAVLIVTLIVAPLMSIAGRSLSGATARAAGQQARRDRVGGVARIAGQAQPRRPTEAIHASRRPTPSANDVIPGEESDATTIDIDRVEGQVKASSMRRVGEIVDKHPGEALTVVRGWMNGER